MIPASNLASKPLPMLEPRNRCKASRSRASVNEITSSRTITCSSGGSFLNSSKNLVAIAVMTEH
jgi:hypothetical protein